MAMLEAALTGGDGAGARGVVRIDLAHDVGPRSEARDCLADDFLGAALAVHLGGVDHRAAELEAILQRVELFTAPPGAFAHAPGAEAEDRHGRAGGKFAGTHQEHP
jgi:hypothetical protein